MKLNTSLLNIINKTYQPDTFLEMKFGRYDLALKTDTDGRAIMIFLGKKDANGKIRGDRYARRLKFGRNNELIKDHWEHKGPATP
ncbi:hypothetical protein ASE74_15900 [Pedobacter sp. Leaf216]|uniref:hypothetical protein n=1 Tax=Pedobacter sp. Leaf216 TaxID=1735684 RepID=UPI0006F9C6D3|nr:hypothetical protein [Pedobacter sp. Leaf216]KQM77882.1 hypothetical protein ASE74_15900 [Pedobacter sp. Leaf216]